MYVPRNLSTDIERATLNLGESRATCQRQRDLDAHQFMERAVGMLCFFVAFMAACVSVLIVAVALLAFDVWVSRPHRPPAEKQVPSSTETIWRV